MLLLEVRTSKGSVDTKALFDRGVLGPGGIDLMGFCFIAVGWVKYDVARGLNMSRSRCFKVSERMC